MAEPKDAHQLRHTAARLFQSYCSIPLPSLPQCSEGDVWTVAVYLPARAQVAYRFLLQSSRDRSVLAEWRDMQVGAVACVQLRGWLQRLQYILPIPPTD